jgi:hypothetical protein
MQRIGSAASGLSKAEMESLGVAATFTLARYALPAVQRRADVTLSVAAPILRQ